MIDLVRQLPVLSPRLERASVVQLPLRCLVLENTFPMSPDKLKAWTDWMIKGQPPSAAGTCETPIESVQAIGQRMRVNATPTIFLANGRRIPGAISLAQLESAITDAAK